MKPMKMIDVIIDEDVNISLPTEKEIRQAVQVSCQTIHKSNDDVELCIRFSSNDVVRELNAKWRQKDNVTDVLSFPMQEGDIDMQQPLGDVILAANFVAGEAKKLHVTAHAHVLHLIVHGVLHLLGFDHINDDEAVVMQQYESDIMQTLDLHNPYPTVGH